MLPTHVTLLAAARFFGPVIVFVALMLLALRQPGSGAGFVAGCVFALALTLHVLVFGAAAARRSFPPMFARILLALGLGGLVVGAVLPGGVAALVTEAGLFALTAAGAHLATVVLIGRAPTLGDGEPP